MIERARSGLVGNRRAHPPAADHPLQSHFLHQPGDRAAGNIEALPPEDRERIKALEREVRELRQANEILRKASAYFAQAELDRRWKP
jgi:transposase-like protein